METGQWYSWSGRDLIIRVHIHTRAKQDALGKVHNNRLKIQITAPPVSGKANNYLTGFLAAEFKLAKSCVEIVKGHLGRDKIIKIRDPKPLPEWFYELIQSDK